MWVEYHHKAALKNSDRYLGAVRSFAKFLGPYLTALGLNPADARLDTDHIDVAEAIYAWENDLLAQFPENSSQPWQLSRSLLALVHHRAERDARVPEKLRKRAATAPTLRKATGEPLDEFSNSERLALKGAAQDDLRALEKHLARGRELLEAGKDPREFGWKELPNLVWAARHRLLTMDELRVHLPAHAKRWPQELREARPADSGALGGFYGLLRGVHALLFPQELDLHPFRVLLLLAMLDCTTEELHGLRVPDLEFSDQGVRIVQTKNRADRIRADYHMVDQPLEKGEVPGELAYEGRGDWDVPGLLRRLVTATALTREVFGGEPWLFTAVEYDKNRSTMDARFARFVDPGRRFTHWIASHVDAAGEPVLAISEPHAAPRLRKTAKTTRVVALGGTLSDMAGDDHSIQVFQGHYAHGTTARVLAGAAMNRAQTLVFDRLADKPVLVNPRVQSRLGEPEVAQALGVSPELGAALSAGELDMGVTNCKNPHDSPHSTPGKLCHVAPAMCMICTNAVVFVSQLPQQLLLSDHIERMRLTQPPMVWDAVWGRQAKALAEVFEECAEHIPAARRAIEDQDIRLNLSLGMRTEYDR
ncbi:hypothetical protein ABZ172_23240 [Streptomyces sp. NPDC006296]|uniref:hypothetical protein n=1 Tax=Streptomyces sp. NPDC006296 TaxID=3156746 RepID=UPI0033A59797